MRTIPILMYHQIDAVPSRVVNGKPTPYRSLIVSPQKFERQMWILKKLGYKALCMGHLLPYLRGEKVGKVVGLTFDDGYQNNVRHALPVLEHHGFSATCYQVAQQVSNSWDARKGIASKALMTLEDCQQWLAGGQEIGSHTQHHVNLNEVSDAVALTEITQSKLQLEARLGRACQHFCYPYGAFSAKHVEMVRQAGYLTATTTLKRRATADDAFFELPRFGIWQGTSTLNFLYKTV